MSALLSAVLAMEGIITLLVIPAVSHDRNDVALQSALAGVLAVLLLLAAGVVRRRGGAVIGSALQPFVVATGLLAWPMWVIGTLFVALWVAALRTVRVVGRPPSSPS